MLTIASALQDLDPALERAAQNLGASPWQTFSRVTLPLSLPGVLAGVSLVIALTLGMSACSRRPGARSPYVLVMVGAFAWIAGRHCPFATKLVEVFFGCREALVAPRC